MSKSDTGFVLLDVVFPRVVLEPSDEQEPVAGDSDFSFGWRATDTSDTRFDVAISIGLPATQTRRCTVEVVTVGHFEMEGEHRTLAKDAFQRGNAAAILFPYAREMIDDLTRRSPFGRVQLPPMNVQYLMKEYTKDAEHKSELQPVKD